MQQQQQQQQPNYNGIPAIQSEQQHNQHHYHHHQQLIENDECFSVSNPFQNLNYPSYQLNSQQKQQQQQLFLQHQVHSIPTTHQLFQHEHFRPPFQQQQGLHSQIVPTRQHQPFFLTKFKLDLDQNNHPTLHVPLHPHSWHPQLKDSTPIKEPFWKQLSTNNNKQASENEEQEAVQGSSKNNKEDLDFGGELEAIYSLAKVAETNQTGSGSALTGENSPKNADISLPVPGQNAGVIGEGNAGIGVDHGSENSIGEEASLRKRQKINRKMKENLSSMAGFFENLVKQVMDHQEMLHRRFLEVIDKMDKERREREETWRKQEATKYNREAISRAHEQALASSREAQIVSCIEKITGQSINLPAKKTPLLLQQELTPTNANTNNRWPKAEVEALILVRTNIETKFEEPGLKGPLWEEVSCLMSSMGYQRSAKKCKEKWENINKYFRKSKESTKKRSLHSKTCSYFNQLDQIYSTTIINSASSKTFSMPPLSSSDIIGVETHQGYSDLLEAFIASRDNATPINPSMKIDEMGTSFDGINNENVSHEHKKDDYDLDSHEDPGGSSEDE